MIEAVSPAHGERLQGFLLARGSALSRRIEVAIGAAGARSGRQRGQGLGRPADAVTPMTCASWVMRVEESLKAVPGVRQASVNLATDQSPKTPHPQPFGIGTRTEIRFGEQHVLTLSVRAGDLLRRASGTAWATVDGEPDDILLAPGDVHLRPALGSVRALAGSA